MTIQAIRENLEQARDEGLRGYQGKSIWPEDHERKLYSICEGLIVEIERLQFRVEQLEARR